MKRRILFLFCLVLAITTFSQTGNYYWSGGKKNMLNIDQTSLSAKISEKSRTATLARITQRSGQVKLAEIGSSGIVSITNVADIQKLKTSLKSEPGVEYVLYNFRSASGGLINTTDRIVLEPKDQTTVNAILEKFPGKLTVLKSNEYNTHLLKCNDPEQVLDLANTIFESGLVKYCHPDFAFPIRRMYDPLEDAQFYLNNTGQGGGSIGVDINAPEAWTFGQNCFSSVKVAVIDDGSEEHEDYAGRVLPGYTAFYQGSGQPVAPKVNHGVAVSGVIAATHNNNLGLKGIAPSAMIIPVNIFSQYVNDSVTQAPTISYVAEAIDWSWNQGQADVLSNSWGGEDYIDVIDYAITRALTQGRGGKGCVVVAAAGNNTGPVQFPARLPGVIAVGAIKNTGDLWGYTARGPEVDLVAPSGDLGWNGTVHTTDRMGTNGIETGNYTGRFGGTSASAPQVSGAAALILGLNPDLTYTQVTSILQQTATDMGTSGFDIYHGYGRLNIAAALNQVMVINAPDYFCSSATATVPVSNSLLPVITWSAIPSNIVSISSSGNTATLTKTGDKVITLYATKSGACGSFTMSKLISVGATPPGNICGPSYDICNDRRSSTNTGVFRVCSPEALPGFTYTWKIDDGSMGGSGNGSSITVRGYMYSVGYHDISVRANTPCGLSNWTTSTFRVISCGTGVRQASISVNLSPNPARNVLSVQASSTTVEPNAGFTKLKIVDKLGRIHRTVSYPASTKSATVNLGGIKPDIYSVLVYDGKEWITKQIVVK
jgi:serine protease